MFKLTVLIMAAFFAAPIPLAFVDKIAAAFPHILAGL